MENKSRRKAGCFFNPWSLQETDYHYPLVQEQIQACSRDEDGGSNRRGQKVHIKLLQGTRADSGCNYPKYSQPRPVRSLKGSPMRVQLQPYNVRAWLRAQNPLPTPGW